MACPCGSGKPEPACCARYHAGELAPTALALMRSRYTAYVRGEIAYLLATHDASTRPADPKPIEKWSRETTWQGLEIVATEAGGATDDTGIVEFIARGSTNGRAFAQRERSRFRKRDGAWFYVDGDVKGETRTAEAKPGRNDPCPCGSGMKYKRCHGA